MSDHVDNHNSNTNSNTKTILPNDLIKNILEICGKDEILKMQDHFPELLGSVVPDKSLVKIQNYKYLKIYSSELNCCYKY
jgi:hypothetical protein